MLDRDELLKRTKELRALTPVAGREFWRCIERDYMSTILESGPNFSSPTSRYSVPGYFSALYFNQSQHIALAEKKQQVPKARNLVLVKFKLALSVPGAVDLLNDDTARILEVEVGRLTLPGMFENEVVANAYTEPRRIAEAVFAAGHPFLLVPSRINDSPLPNLVVFPANFFGVLIERIDVSPVPN